MSGRRSQAKARRAIRDRWVPTVLRVSLGLALFVGLSGLALGTYLLSGHSLAGQSGPSLAVPFGSPAVAGDGTGSASLDTAPMATAAGDPSQPPAPLPSLAAPATSSAGQTRATAAKATALSVPSTTTAAPRTSAASSAPATNATYEQQVLALTNAERTAVGCPALVWNVTLASVARAHSQDMATNSYFDHNSRNGTTPEQRITAAGYSYRAMAENIAAGQATPADVMASWMASAGHRANILNCSLTQLGVGFATGGSYGSYWTQDFGTP